MKNLLGRIETCNPVLGCNIGCPYCYASRLNTRFHFTPDFRVPTIMPNAIKKIHSIRPKTLFMTSMSDLSGWPINWRNEVFSEIERYPRNSYMFLTKRPDLVEDLDCRSMKNVWIGVTITSKADISRIQKMKQNIKSSGYWLCIEPLHGDLGAINLSGIDFIILGAETGNRAGKIIPKAEWIFSIVAQADKYKVPVLMKESLLPIIGEKNFREDWIPCLV